jgi:hypothetical protein
MRCGVITILALGDLSAFNLAITESIDKAFHFLKANPFCFAILFIACHNSIFISQFFWAVLGGQLATFDDCFFKHICILPAPEALCILLARVLDVNSITTR